MTPARQAELRRLASLPPECPDIGQALRDRIDLIGAVQELLSEVEHLKALVKFRKHLRSNLRRS